MEIIISLLALLVTVLGWSITAYYQRQILERTIAADKEKPVQQRRLEVLPKARDKMLEMQGHIAHLTRRLTTYPDFKSMSAAQLMDFVNSLEFTSLQKEELLKADDKQEYYREKRFWHELGKAETCFTDFHNYVLLQKIFMDPELFNQFMAIDTLFASALSDLKVAKQMHDFQMVCLAGEELNRQAPIIIEKIENMIRVSLIGS